MSKSDSRVQVGKSLASQVQRLRGWVGSDPSRTPELADALVALTEHRLLAHDFAGAAADAQASVKLAAQLLTADGPIGPYTSTHDAARYLDAVVQFAVMQAAAGLVAEAATTVASADGLRTQLAALPLISAVRATTPVWALNCQGRAALAAADPAKANALADAALHRLHGSQAAELADPGNLALDSERLVSDARWAAGAGAAAVAHLLAARSAYDALAAGPLSAPGRLDETVLERLVVPLFGLYRDLADRLIGIGEVDYGLVVRRELLARLRELTSYRSEAPAQAAATLTDLERDLRNHGHRAEASLIAEELAALPAPIREAAAALAPGGSALAPGGSALAPGGSTLAPGGSTLAPGGSALAPGGSALAPGGAIGHQVQWAPLSADEAWTSAQDSAAAVREERFLREMSLSLAALSREARAAEARRELEAAAVAADHAATREAAAKAAVAKAAAERAAEADQERLRVAAEAATEAELAAAAAVEHAETKRRRATRIEEHRIEQERLEQERLEQERPQEEGPGQEGLGQEGRVQGRAESTPAASEQTVRERAESTPTASEQTVRERLRVASEEAAAEAVAAEREAAAAVEHAEIKRRHAVWIESHPMEQEQLDQEAPERSSASSFDSDGSPTEAELAYEAPVKSEEEQPDEATTEPPAASDASTTTPADTATPPPAEAASGDAAAGPPAESASQSEADQSAEPQRWRRLRRLLGNRSGE